MKIAIVMPTYKRPEILEKVLNHLKLQVAEVNAIIFTDDASDEEKINELIFDKDRRFPGKNIAAYIQSKNQGPGPNINYALWKAFTEFKCDYAIVMDSDVIVEPDDWIIKMIRFLESHPEVGIAFPDKPGCYVRLHRNGYDEIEFGITNCYAVSKKVVEFVHNSDGHWNDSNLVTAFDCDLCYRVRLHGWRCALVLGTGVKDLSDGVSTVPGRLAKYNFYFNRKWNERLIGRFVYKSEGGFLRWEDYPLNLLFRRLVNAQQGTLIVGAKVHTRSENGELHELNSLCGHDAEAVVTLACRGNYPKQESLRRFIAEDIFVEHNQKFDEIRPEVSEKGEFNPDLDYAEFSLKRRKHDQ